MGLLVWFGCGLLVCVLLFGLGVVGCVFRFTLSLCLRA